LLNRFSRSEGCKVRVGIGFDSHNLVPGRKLVLGGIEIPFELGLEGHSDADVLIHAIIDALFGAACLGSVGDHFPDTDERYRDIASTKLLGESMSKIREAKLQPVNVDSVIVAERPRLAPHISAMRSKIAATMRIPEDRVSVKATTTEGKDATGRGEAIAAHAAVLLAENG
jgi:2-C-methyl-D-erythritol 2,4-cyclodiphosphate synthase